MKRKLIGLVCFLTIAVLVGIFSAGLAISEEVCLDTGTLPLKAPADVEIQRSEKVDFPHGAHFDYNCKECHHKWDGKAAITGCQTSGCHDSSTSLLKTDPDQNYRYFKNAYHDMCITCHKEITIANKKLEESMKNLDKPLPKTGPIGCVGCHPQD